MIPTDMDREGEKLQVGTRPRPGVEAPPFRSHLTIIWAEEKAELLRRISELEHKVNILEHQVRGTRTEALGRVE
jgi:hypothetical protein